MNKDRGIQTHDIVYGEHTHFPFYTTYDGFSPLAVIVVLSDGE